jgi:hypothetical protein
VVIWPVMMWWLACGWSGMVRDDLAVLVDFGDRFV